MAAIGVEEEQQRGDQQRAVRDQPDGAGDRQPRTQDEHQRGSNEG
jgi:hypothetical protein